MFHSYQFNPPHSRSAPQIQCRRRLLNSRCTHEARPKFNAAGGSLTPTALTKRALNPIRRRLLNSHRTYVARPKFNAVRRTPQSPAGTPEVETQRTCRWHVRLALSLPKNSSPKRRIFGGVVGGSRNKKNPEHEKYSEFYTKMVRQKGLEHPTLGTGILKKFRNTSAHWDFDNKYDNSHLSCLLFTD